MVIEVSSSEVGRGLRNHFRAFHSLTIPESGSVLGTIHQEKKLELNVWRYLQLLYGDLAHQ